MAIADPKLTIKNLLATNWTASNTSNVTPTFGTGWFNEESKHPQVTVTDRNDTPIRGGETGYQAIKSDGSGPTQTIIGTANVNVWSTRDANSVNPKQLTHEMAEEVQRIVLANYNGSGDLRWLAWGGALERVDTQVRPAVFRYLCEVRYSYQRSP